MRRRLLKRAWRILTVSPWQLRAIALASEGMCRRTYASLDGEERIIYVHPCENDCLWLDAYTETVNP
jgi:hypothetical protein